MSQDIDRIDLMMDYLRGDLSPANRRQAEKLISEDRHKDRLFAIVKRLFLESKKTDWQQARESSLKLASRLFKDYQKSKKRPGANPGINIFDSRMFPLPGGVRPAKVDTSRLKYRVGELTLELSLYPVSTESYELIGQVLDLESDQQLYVKLHSSGKDDFEIAADRFYLFRFDRIPKADYTLELILGNNKIGTVALQL